MIAALICSVAANAELFKLRPGWQKLQLIGDHLDVASLLAGTHGELLWRYSDTFVLLYAPAGEIATIESHATTPLNARVIDDRIRLGTTVIDPAIGIPHSVPASQRITSYPPNERGLYVIQYIGSPMRTGRKRSRRSAGGFTNTSPTTSSGSPPRLSNSNRSGNSRFCSGRTSSIRSRNAAR